MCLPLVFIFNNAFLKNKESSGTSLSASFLHDFWKNIFFLLYSIDWPNFIAWLNLLFEVLVIVFCPACDVINIKINLTFLIKPLSWMTKKSGQKCKYVENKKKLLPWHRKQFSSFLKGFQLSEIVSDLRVGI